MSYFFELLLGITVEILAHYLIKWLDDEDKR
ncbi:hypothetical protein D8788_02150 [Streptococcus mitis]|jgi:hypothetical protein|uniref:Uncharacterized protein n=1 Tax=Streptococcus mitis TaxID=28037 RepID=A0A3R9KXW1_STRMT|nr:hypothetical protein D8788_02150 [Streptococcus mitis]DAT17262.1 MAG TPA: toxin [Caudoviricetes sp.]